MLVTGAAGFIGSALTRCLVGRGATVVALLQPGADHSNLDGVKVEGVAADVRNRSAVLDAASGCRVIFHVAALYRFWTANADEFYEINVGGTLNVLEAAGRSACDRLVYTSTVGTIGLDAATTAAPATEKDWPRVEHLFGLYKRSKYVAEHEVLRASAEGLPAVLVQPTTPVGPRDRGPTPTGRTVLDFLNGKLPGWLDTSLNIVDVEDVALGHVLAAERGRQGRSYILGGENLSFRRILDLLAEITGLPAPRLRIPKALAVSAAVVSELAEGRIAKRPPTVPLEGARMATTHMLFDDARARSELGYSSRPSPEALERSARWFVDNGYVSERRAAKIRWAA